jgi:hypothetical protein
MSRTDKNCGIPAASSIETVDQAPPATVIDGLDQAPPPAEPDKSTPALGIMTAASQAVARPGQTATPTPAEDLARLRLNPARLTDMPSKKLVTVIQVRRPDPGEFFRTKINDILECYAFVENDGGKEIYPATPEIADEYSNEVKPYKFVPYISRYGDLKVWPIRLYEDDSRVDSWTASANDAILLAADTWIRITSNRRNSAYDIYPLPPTLTIPEPEWPPEASPENVVTLAFRARKKIVEDREHPVIRRLDGRA